MATYELGRVPRIYVGADAIAGLCTLVESLGARSVVLIADHAVAANGYAAKLTAALDGMSLGEHVVPPGEPTCATVNDAADFVRRYADAAVIGVGGGSALDTAKQAAAVAASREGVEHYLLSAHPFAGKRPMIAIPTTAGTGSEVTRTCIVSDANGRKMWTWGDELLPDAVILDPAATVTMPATITAATGLDAFVHALEARTGQRRNAIAGAPALQAIRIIRHTLAIPVRDPNNLEARQAMQEAALLAGIAIDGCGTGIAHCIGHALGTLYHIPHGVAVTLAIEAALAWNIGGDSEIFAEVADTLDVRIPELPFVLRELLDETRFADAVRVLPDAALAAEAIAEAMIAEENQPMLRNNVRVPNAAEQLELARGTVAVWNTYRAGVRV